MKARYFFIAAVIFGILTIVALRGNAKTALAWRDGILAKDQAAAEVDVDIKELRAYVFKHMNSSVRFELTGSYDRAVEAAQRESVSGEVYSAAQAACDRQGDSSVVQAQCVQRFLADRLSNNPVRLPEKAQYTYAFASPSWSPDWAGFSLLIALALTTTALGFYILELFAKSRMQS